MTNHQNNLPAEGAVAGAKLGDGAGAGTGAELGWGSTCSCSSFLAAKPLGAVAGARAGEGAGAGTGATDGFPRTGSCCSFRPAPAEGTHFLDWKGFGVEIACRLHSQLATSFSRGQ